MAADGEDYGIGAGSTWMSSKSAADVIWFLTTEDMNLPNINYLVTVA